jgi:hypothetical protein
LLVEVVDGNIDDFSHKRKALAEHTRIGQRTEAARLSIDTTRPAALALGRMSATIGRMVMHSVSRGRNNEEISDTMASVHLCP